MRRLRGHRDEGFSLIEVIVAIVIIGIVASSALWFFINGMQKSSNLDRQQAAVTLATSTMEKSFVLNPRVDAVAGVSGLLIGRSSAEVNAAFAALGPAGLKIDGVANTYPLSDPAGASGADVLKIVDTVTLANNVPYKIYTLVGSCYRTASASGASQDCQKVTGYTSEPATTPPGKAKLLRVIVVVTWKPIGAECNGLCTYDVATLVDPSLDLEWNRVIEPIALDDLRSFTTTSPGVTLDVLANDVLGSVPNYPVSILSALPAGKGTLGSPDSHGAISYTPPAAVKGTWTSGIFDFTYRVRDSRGQNAQAKVSIALQPASADDPNAANSNARYDAYLGVPQVLDVIANDLGSPTLVKIVAQPSRGTVSVSGTQVTYTPTSTGNDQFSYTYSDAYELLSPVATVKINVQAVSVTDVTVPIAYRTSTSGSAGWIVISSYLRGALGGSASITLTVEPSESPLSPAGGKLRVDGAIYDGGPITGTKVEFQPPANVVGEWTFPFALKQGTYQSASATATMRVPVVATNDGSWSFKRDGTRDVISGGNVVGTNDNPKTWTAATGASVATGTITGKDCGAWATVRSEDAAAGNLRITFPNKSASNCTATYILTGGGTTSTGTITYKTTS